MMYFDFGEINIIKEKNGNFKFINVGGTLLSVDLETAGIILALQGHTLEEALLILKTQGYEIKEKDIQDTINSLDDLDLTNKELQKPTSRRFDTEVVIRNLKTQDEGPVLIQDVAITLSNACPMNCAYCFRRNFNYVDKLNLDIAKRVNSELRKLGCVTINISGGEPSVFFDLTKDVAQDAKDKGFDNISVSTTGFGLDTPRLLEWKKAGITYLNVCLDTMDRDAQDKIFRKEGAWDGAISAIKDACRAGLQVRINCTAYQETLSQIFSLTKFAKEVGAYKIRINPYVPCADLPPVSPHQTREAVNIIRKLEEEGYPVYSPISPEETLPDLMICAAGITKAVIETDGSVGGCQFMGDYPHPAGNVLQDSFMDIWTKGDWSYYREGIDTEKISSPCRGCPDRAYCVSNCIAYARALLGDGKIKKDINCPFKDKK